MLCLLLCDFQFAQLIVHYLPSCCRSCKQGWKPDRNRKAPPENRRGFWAVAKRKGSDQYFCSGAYFSCSASSRSLGNSWARDGITVNCICPGYFPTEMTAAYIDAPFFHQAHLECCPMERHGETGEMDGLCTYFASPACSYTTGQIVCVDGGWSAI